MSSLSSLTIHGGRLDAAARRFPDAPPPWIDLSTGINPRRYPIAGLSEIDQGALPSRDALVALETAAAASFGLGAGAIAALPGSEIGLRLLATLGLPALIRVLRPCYRTHREAFDDVATITAADLAEAAGEGGTIVLANPNNPDGRLIAPERLLDVARRLAARGGWLVVDEAFADAVERASVLPLLGADDRVLVMRSFGKFHGLAGVRLGFACGHPAIVERLRDRLGDWPVSATALALGTAAYRDAGWAAAARIAIREDAGRLDALLAGHGLKASGACPLFRLVATREATALAERLGRAGILARPFAEEPTWLRFGLPPDEAAFARLDRALDGR